MRCLLRSLIIYKQTYYDLRTNVQTKVKPRVFIIFKNHNFFSSFNICDKLLIQKVCLVKTHRKCITIVIFRRPESHNYLFSVMVKIVKSYFILK